MLSGMRIIHPDPAVCGAVRERAAACSEITVVEARFEELPPHDAFVTAGNAFGIMTAGIDAAVVAVLGPEIMRRVQHRIMDEYFGEQPVGTAFVIDSGHSAIPFLVHAPTMRVPGSIAGTDKVYSATWAALLAIHRFNLTSDRKIEIATFPAMGTGFGGVPATEAGRQMVAAWRHYREPPHRLDWDHVASRQRSICYDGDRQVVRG